MIISCIVATDNNGAIGKNNDIPWYLPADLKYFKKTTINKPILMGRKCFQSIGKPLPKRTNIIVTRDPYFIVSNCVVCSSLEEALEWANDQKFEELMIIGGGTIYDQTADLWDRLYLTQVDLEVEDAEIFFTDIDYSQWNLIREEANQKDDKNEYNYTFKYYERK